MNQQLNIYCDESCHLEHDGKNVMVLGAVWCPSDHVRNAHLSLRNLKRTHGLADRPRTHPAKAAEGIRTGPKESWPSR
ncbi:MAG TPA: hypothetical protein DEW46_13385 [Verrucomicrobia bacterium]|nr:hypothetical protein [Verrucomicrobiota bacterium]